MNVFTPERVTLDMSRDAYQKLIWALGIATGYAAKEGIRLRPFLVLVNAINEGNPDWKPYEVKEEPPQ